MRRQAYVFAKGILQDAGFAWRVRGDVDGFAANTVTVQTPAPGTRVIDNGAPVVTLRLARSAQYAERGVPENSAPFTGSKVVLLKNWQAEQKKNAPPVAEAARRDRSCDDDAGSDHDRAGRRPPPPRPTTAPTSHDSGTRSAARAGSGLSQARFHRLRRAGRARRRDAASGARTRARGAGRQAEEADSPRFVNFWLYQHSWIVTGARFGWKDGDVALKTLIRVDGSLQKRFGFGRRSQFHRPPRSRLCREQEGLGPCLSGLLGCSEGSAATR